MSNINFAFPMGGSQITPTEKNKLSELCADKEFACEIGCWVGESTSVLAECIRKNAGHLYVVDWFKGNFGTDLTARAQQHNILEIFKDNMYTLGLLDYISIIDAKSEDAVKVIYEEAFDFIFLDADHTYPHAKHDITEWFEKLQPGGTFVGHDYDSDTYEEEHIHKDFIHNKHNGLIKAVNEIFGSQNIERGAGSLWWVQK